MKPLLRWMPQVFFLGLALVTIMSLIPSTSVPQAFQFWDKAQHALGYAALSVTGCRAFPQRVMPVVVGLLAHGAAIEIMQATLTTTRFGDVFDWLADGIGILAGLGIYHYALPKPAA
jgi:VanZ family protein